MAMGLTDLGLLGQINNFMLGKAMSQRHQDFRLVASQLGYVVGMTGPPVRTEAR
ncbi:MAG: hypothetical protein IH870_03445 [Chloroflexi bacterium]|nr:hypothetical protein [Chloroflexota bacterium]